MPKAAVEEKNGILVVKLPCRFDSQTAKKYGEVTFRFHVDEEYLPVALRAVIGADKQIMVVIVRKKEKLPIGKMTFGGLAIKRVGESILSLDTVADEVRLPIQRISDLAQEDITLLLGIRVGRK